ncbi:unnamed protein product [Toxocara canis]|uniref:Uncharacterized protein n=1 Tax=Toxocara canis TaxID=6265 RepID=A0A183TX34_TOXCA|nr:unnamed protein product [Toxocara canis]
MAKVLGNRISIYAIAATETSMDDGENCKHHKEVILGHKRREQRVFEDTEAGCLRTFGLPCMPLCNQRRFPRAALWLSSRLLKCRALSR